MKGISGNGFKRFMLDCYLYRKSHFVVELTLAVLIKKEKLDGFIYEHLRQLLLSFLIFQLPFKVLLVWLTIIASYYHVVRWRYNYKLIFSLLVKWSFLVIQVCFLLYMVALIFFEVYALRFDKIKWLTSLLLFAFIL